MQRELINSITELSFISDEGCWSRVGEGCYFFAVTSLGKDHGNEGLTKKRKKWGKRMTNGPTSDGSNINIFAYFRYFQISGNFFQVLLLNQKKGFLCRETEIFSVYVAFEFIKLIVLKFTLASLLFLLTLSESADHQIAGYVSRDLV